MNLKEIGKTSWIRKMIFYKNFILFTFIILLNYGCSSLPNNIAGNFRDAFDAIGAGIFGFDDYPIT